MNRLQIKLKLIDSKILSITAMFQIEYIITYCYMINYTEPPRTREGQQLFRLKLMSPFIIKSNLTFLKAWVIYFVGNTKKINYFVIFIPFSRWGRVFYIIPVS